MQAHHGTGSQELPVPPELDDEANLPSSSHREEREELARVLNYSSISRSANLVRFLSFICNKYFDGEADDIRERTVAIEALGRREYGFDSHADPIVRVTARELRKKLSEYYATEGKQNPLRIILPRGRYIPQFVRAGNLQLEEASQPEHETVAASAPEASASLEEASVFGKMYRSPLYRYAALAAVLLAVFSAGILVGRNWTERPAAGDAGSIKWGDPVWSDDFNGSAGQLPDSSKWSYDLGNQNGWGNHELEVYCSPRSAPSADCDPHRPNVFLDGYGHLVLRAQRNTNGVWTSARMTTQSLKTFQYGRIEARMKLPVGAGLWPSFWLLGADFPSIGWPAAGAVAVAENVSTASRSDGLGPSTIRATIHGPRYSGGNGLWHDFTLPNGQRVDDGTFHTYGMIWSPGMMQFYVDDPNNVFFVQSASDIPQGGEWVFDNPFFLILNLAVGGDWPGNPDNTTPNPAEVLVDYVRVYNIPPVPAPSIQWDPVSVKAGSAAASIIRLHAPSSAGRVYLSCSTQPATATCALASPVVDFSDNLSQEDSLTISTDSFAEKGRLTALPGIYKLTITATTISGARSQITRSFEVKSS